MTGAISARPRPPESPRGPAPPCPRRAMQSCNASRRAPLTKCGFALVEQRSDHGQHRRCSATPRPQGVIETYLRRKTTPRIAAPRGIPSASARRDLRTPPEKIDQHEVGCIGASHRHEDERKPKQEQGANHFDVGLQVDVAKIQQHRSQVILIRRHMVGPNPWRITCRSLFGLFDPEVTPGASFHGEHCASAERCSSPAVPHWQPEILVIVGKPERSPAARRQWST